MGTALTLTGWHRGVLWVWALQDLLRGLCQGLTAAPPAHPQAMDVLGLPGSIPQPGEGVGV